MKKQVKRLLSVGLCLALGLSVGGGLAACKDSGENTPTVDWNAGTWSKPEASYWIAGTLNGYENTLAKNGWGEDLGEESVPAERRFEQNSENDKLWRLVINLYKDEEFKIRFGALGWDEENGKSKLSADTNLDKSVADDKNGIYDATGGMGGSNFKVAADGQYEVRIDATGAPSVVTYVRKGDAPKLPVKVTEVQLSSTTLTLTAGGDTATLTATVLPEDAVDKEVTWRSLKPSVATVDDNGVVTPVAKGSAIIVATAGGVEAECAVTVVEAGTTIVDVTGVTLDKTVATVNAGTPVTLTATVAPEDATNKTVTWASSDEKIATVDKNGKVTAVKPGTATITATAGGDKTAECEVTVPDGYYLFGKFNKELGAGEWADLTGKLDTVSAKIVFTQDAENADKYTLEAAFNRGDQIKILPMSGPDKNWTNVIGFGQLVDENNKFSNGGSGNIKFLDSAKYKLTLEKVADTSDGAAEGAKKLQLSYEILEDIDDVTYESYKVEVWGTGNKWASAYAEKTVDAVTATEQWKAEITLTLAADEVFQFRQIYGTPVVTNHIGAGQGVNGSNASGDLFTNHENNYKCITAGTYKFTLQFNEYGECESVTAVAVTE